MRRDQNWEDNINISQRKTIKVGSSKIESTSAYTGAQGD